jgi:tetratricopeptide (TPR) repeat protein
MQVTTGGGSSGRATPALKAALALAVAAVAFGAFLPALDASFVSWDDGLTVTDNYAIRAFDAQNLRWMWTTSTAGHYQPLSWMSLALDHALFGLHAPDFPEARGFHATNLLLHAAGAAALFALALALLTRACAPRPGGAPRAWLGVAAAAALAHALHPLRCESVCWVTERRDVLSAPFFVLALLAWLHATPSGPPRALRPGWLALCAAGALTSLGVASASVSLADPRELSLTALGAPGLALAALLWLFSVGCAARGIDATGVRRRGAWLLAMHLSLLVSLCAKAWGIVVPALLVVLDFWPLRRLAPAPPGAGEPGAWPGIAALVVEKLPSAVLALAFARLAAWAQLAQQGSVDVLALHTPADRAVQALYGLSFYPWKTLLPLGLAPLYPIPDDLRIGEPRFAVAALATLALCGLALALVRRAPAVTAAWVAYVATIAPVLGVLQSGPQLVADRYAYLAGIPFALLFGGALWIAWQRSGAVRAGSALVAVCALASLAALSWRQSGIWRDSETLWTYAYARAPDSPLAALNLGLVRAWQAEKEATPERRIALRDEALRLVGEASARQPGNGLYRINEAIVLADRAADRPEPLRSRDLARADALAASAIASAEAEGRADASWYFQHGRILAAAQRTDEAGARFERALALRPAWPVPRLFLAALLLDQAGREAAAQPARALALVSRAQGELDAVVAAAPETRSIAAVRERAAAMRSELEQRVRAGETGTREGGSAPSRRP